MAPSSSDSNDDNVKATRNILHSQFLAKRFSIWKKFWSCIIKTEIVLEIMSQKKRENEDNEPRKNIWFFSNGCGHTCRYMSHLLPEQLHSDRGESQCTIRQADRLFPSWMTMIRGSRGREERWCSSCVHAPFEISPTPPLVRTEIIPNWHSCYPHRQKRDHRSPRNVAIFWRTTTFYSITGAQHGRFVSRAPMMG